MRLARRLGVEFSWQGLGADGVYDVIFSPDWGEIDGKIDGMAEESRAYYRQYGNTPTRSRGDRELGRVLLDYLRRSLPEYMVPAAIVGLEALPLTPSGKLDRRALPEPGGGAYASREYERPEGEVEIALARIWAELLKVERVGRNDNFFELGGHSLLAISLIERMRREGLSSDVRTLFSAPTLRVLAEAVTGASDVEAPPNLIPEGCLAITPEMLPLAELTQEEIDAIVSGVPGGAANVQDIYPLAPLQEGILFHHLMNAEGDAYLLHSLLAFDTRERLERLLGALRAVIARHDILRTALVWEGLREPAQVVWREAPLPVEEVELDPDGGGVVEQLLARFDPRGTRLDLSRAPLMRCVVAREWAGGRWLLLWLFHHLTNDHTTLEIMVKEARAYLLREIGLLPEPVPFRNYVAQARLRGRREEEEAFFREMLGDVDEPTSPYGLLEARGDGTGINEARAELDAGLAAKLRGRARALGVSAASVCHLAWGMVLGRLTGREDVVFGTVLFGRMGGGEGADRALGLFINTLPIRLRVGKDGVERSVRRTQELLGELVKREHASLALAQRCSGVTAPTPLFSSLFNYRHSPRRKEGTPGAERAWEGIELLDFGDRTNYPLAMSVDDLGDGFALTVQGARPVEPGRVCNYMRTALEGLVEALERMPWIEVRDIEVQPEAERRQLLEEWNATRVEYPREKCVHELFEEQVERSPESVAVAYEGGQLSYGELNARANRLARHLRELGVGPDVRVAICMERSLEMVVGLLGALKAGGAYLPLDPAYPPERLAYMLEDGEPVVLLSHEAALSATAVRPPKLPVLNLGSEEWRWADQSESNLERSETGLEAGNLAYVIYTSGSTGAPKGAMNEHQGLVNRLAGMQRDYGLEMRDAVLQKTPFSFDVSVWEFFWPLLYGGRLVMARPDGHKNPEYLAGIIQQQNITTLHFVPSMLQAFLEYDEASECRRLVQVICSGEALSPSLAGRFHERLPDTELYNLYGPAEAAIDVTGWNCRQGTISAGVPIGHPLANTRVYILDTHQQLTPPGAVRELYIGGVQVGRGYLARPRLTAERFVPDSFGVEPGARLYRTGDLARWRADGNLEFLGRNDFQVKLRGIRIELGEIETKLAAHPELREVVVVAIESGDAGKRLVAYYTGGDVGAEALRDHLDSVLPEYMIPAAYVHLEALPLTPSGKLDRKALPAPEVGAYANREYEPPEGEVEIALARIWAELLKVERVGRNDNFFELGGHSLLAIQVLSRLRQSLGVEVALASLFAHPILAEFARAIEGAAQAELPPIARADRSRPLELSFAQQRLWFLAQFEGASRAYHIGGGLRLRGELDRQALCRALDRIVARHEALRTTFSWLDGRPVQIIGPAEGGFQLTEHDLSHETEATDELRRLAEREAGEPFDLEGGPADSRAAGATKG